MSHTLDSAASSWLPVPAVPADALVDARLQLHHAAQVANSPAISYLAPAPDDSHTNFGWSPDLRAFVSQRVELPRARRFAWRPIDLALLSLDDGGAVVSAFSLAGHTLADAHAWARGECEAAGADAAGYTRLKHYEIPSHAVASGAPFSVSAAASTALSLLWSNASTFLDAAANLSTHASSVRLWPHHFDLGLLDAIDDTRSIGAGFSPGDHYYLEPYFYLSPYPRPVVARRPSLDGGAHWHEDEFFSAVLPWRTFVAARSPGTAVAAYFRSAIEGARSLLGA